MNNINYTSNGLNQFYSDARFSGIQGQGQTIVVIDVGFNLNHTGFGTDANNDGVKDVFLRKDLDFTTRNNGVNDGYPHGLGTSSVAYNVAKGINILPIQVSTTRNITDALNWVSQNQARYGISGVNISLSDATNTASQTPDLFYQNFYKSLGMLEEKGVSVVAAAGNYYRYYKQDGANSMASFNNVIGVMSSNSNGTTDNLALSDFSQRRPDLIAAPGYAIPVFGSNNTQSLAAGTSYAAPFITGSIALLQGVAERYMGRRLRPSEMKSLINLTDTELTATNSRYEQINVFNAAELIYDIGTGRQANILSPNLMTNIEYRPTNTLTSYSSTLTGGRSIDVLTGKSVTSNLFQGGLGGDLLVGGVGRNTFAYNNIAEGKDEILDFTPGKDKIDVSRILDTYRYLGNNPLTDGMIRVGLSSSNDSVITIDFDGIGSAQPQVLATVVGVPSSAMNNSNNFIF